MRVAVLLLTATIFIILIGTFFSRSSLSPDTAFPNVQASPAASTPAPTQRHEAVPGPAGARDAPDGDRAAEPGESHDKTEGALRRRMHRGRRGHHGAKSANETNYTRNYTLTLMKTGNSRFHFGVDTWVLPNASAFAPGALTLRTPATLHEGVDFHGNAIDYGDFPGLRLNEIYGKKYLVYVYVNEHALEAAVNLIVSCRRYGIPHVLLLCENEATAAHLREWGLYHYYPKDLLAKISAQTMESYWGPSMWVRCNFNHHLVQHGVSVAFFDADIVLVNDPRPVLFARDTDMSTSFRMASIGPWTWTFPFLDRHTWHREPTLAAVLNRHFLELNNGISRYDSNANMMVFFEVMRQRILLEVAQAEAFPVLFQTVKNFQGRIDLSLKNSSTQHFAYHAFGHVSRGAEQAWYVKLAYLHGVCWTLTPDAMDVLQRWNASLGEEALYRRIDAGNKCCQPKCEEVRQERSRWGATLLDTIAKPNSTFVPPAFRYKSQGRA